MISTHIYLFIFIQVDSAMFFGDLRKLDTNITVNLPVRFRERGVKRRDMVDGISQRLHVKRRGKNWEDASI